LSREQKLCYSLSSAETTLMQPSDHLSGLKRKMLCAGDSSTRKGFVGECSGLAAAGNKSATRPPLPLPGCGGEWEEAGRNWWVGIRAV